jgi:hypothetical protein
MPAKPRSQVLFEKLELRLTARSAVVWGCIRSPEACVENPRSVSISTDTSGAFHKHQDLRQITPL